MINVQFTKQMKERIKSLKGKRFVSYSMDDDCFADRSYCKIRITTDDFCLEIMNEVQAFPFIQGSIDDTEEMSCFSCQEKSLGSKYEPYLEGVKYKEIEVNETICEVSIVSDVITIEQEKYDICFDMAIIIKTESHTYTFYRQWYYDEYIFIGKDVDFDSVYSIDDVRTSWDNDGEYAVTVERTYTKL